MIYNLNITDPRFSSVSDVVLANYQDFDFENLQNINGNNDAYPGSIYLCDLNNLDDCNEVTLNAARGLINHVETQHNLFCTLSVYYPATGGHIDWHDNSNFEFYNAICTYSHSGNSFFEYMLNGEIHRINDPVGWTVKKTKWSNSEKVPHRAMSNDHRITFSFSSTDEELIDIFISSITE